MRQKSPKHLDFIRSLGCLICGDATCTEAAHVRYAEPLAGKLITGMGIKSHDKFTVPLCSRHHREQHANGERSWWSQFGIDPVYAALALHSVTGDNETGSRICAAWAAHSRSLD